MKYKLLGKTGLRISELALGTMTFGEDWGWGSKAETSQQIFDYFLDQGGNLVDTANIYTQGTSEEITGKLMKGKRHQIVLSTKYGASTDPNNPNAGGASRKNVVQAVEASLKRLGTDYIDLYWLHVWDQSTPEEEYLRALDDLVQQGKVLYLGISDTPAWVVARCNALAEANGLTPFSALQIEYNLLARTPDREFLPMAERYGLTTTIWSPLAAGMLTGKYLDAPGGGRISKVGDELYQHYMTDRADGIVRKVLAVAEEVEASPAQVALAWAMAKSSTIIPIVGATKMHHIQDNLGALDVALSKRQIAALDEISEVELGFPYDFYRSRKNRIKGNH